MHRRSFIKKSMAASFVSSFSLNFNREGCEIEVINAGVGGNNSSELLDRIDADCLAQNPDLTIVMVGTNDMNTRKYIPLEQFDANLRKIIGMILRNGSELVIMNLLPVYEPYLFTRHDPDFYMPEGHSGRLRLMNSVIEKAASALGVAMVDIHHVFQKAGNVGLDKTSWIRNEANSNTTDGLHPTAEGYRAIALTLYQHIKNNKLHFSRLVCFGDSITRGDGSTDGESYPAWLKKLLN